MKTLLELYGCSCVVLKMMDFTSINPQSKPYRKAKYILVDAPCSGSGAALFQSSSVEEQSGNGRMAKRLEYNDDEGPDHHRLNALSTLQTALLRHALNFPHVRRVVYSTCSIYKEENERVIEKIVGEFRHQFELVLPEGYEDLSREEHSSIRLACVGTYPDRDLCNGFFVAVFQRLKRNRQTETSRHDDTPLVEANATEKLSTKKRKRKDEMALCEAEVIARPLKKKKKKKKKVHDTE